MAENLLIIESPNKTESLRKYLGKNFDIVATVGHVRDLKRFTMGFDPETLDPQWVITPKNPLRPRERPKKEIIEEILSLSKKAKHIYLATDPDREGEAIAWHVYDLMPKSDQEKTTRVTFNEITAEAVKESFNNDRQIDKQWVESQFARRIFDRMIGYRLSKLVQRSLKADSAGRVQSVALKFIEDREKEIEAFKPEFWWTLDVTLEGDLPLVLRSISPSIKAPSAVQEGDKSGIDFKDEKDALAVKDSLGPVYSLYSVDDPEFYSRSPREPYKTSTLQQDAVNKLGWQARKVMNVAQSLYEGVGEGDAHRAYISYPRTDSTRISAGFAKSVQSYLNTEHGPQYVSANPVLGKAKSQSQEANTQDAHEGIRPTDIEYTPDRVKSQLSKDEYALYKLIWVRTVSAFMPPAKFKRVTMRFDNAGNKFYGFSREMVFDGYRKIYTPYKNEDSERLVDVKAIEEKKNLKADDVEITHHSTNPPPRYTQASLVQALEESGVGRPSTYSTMANVCLDRGYAELVSRAFVPTEQGRKVANVINATFPDVINRDFTSEMEMKLDKIAEGEIDWKEPLREFWPDFNSRITKMIDEIPVAKDEPVGRDCPKCGNPLVYRTSGKGSRFIGCSTYPKCKHTEPLVPHKKIGVTCPDCGGDLIERLNKRGEIFIGCENFPKCRFVGNYNEKKEVVKYVPKTPGGPRRGGGRRFSSKTKAS